MNLLDESGISEYLRYINFCQISKRLDKPISDVKDLMLLVLREN